MKQTIWAVLIAASMMSAEVLAATYSLDFQASTVGTVFSDADWMGTVNTLIALDPVDHNNGNKVLRFTGSTETALYAGPERFVSPGDGYVFRFRMLAQSRGASGFELLSGAIFDSSSMYSRSSGRLFHPSSEYGTNAGNVDASGGNLSSGSPVFPGLTASWDVWNYYQIIRNGGSNASNNGGMVEIRYNSTPFVSLTDGVLWINGTAPATVPGLSANGYFGLRGVDNVYFDDVSLMSLPVPEPSTGVLMGMVVVFSLRRYRGG